MIALIDYGAGNLTSVKKALAAVGADVFVPARPEALAAARSMIVPGVGHFGATRALDGAWVAAIRARADEGCPLLGICLGMQWLYDWSDEAPDLKGLGVLPGRVVRLKADPTYQTEVSHLLPTSVGSGSGRVPPHEGSSTGGVPSDVGSGSGGIPPHEGSGSGRVPPHEGSGTGGVPSSVGSGFSRTYPLKVPHVGWNSLTVVRDASLVEGVASGAQVYFTHSYVAPVTADTAAITEHGQPFAAIVQRDRIAGVQFHPEKSGDVGLRILRNFLRLSAL